MKWTTTFLAVVVLLVCAPIVSVAGDFHSAGTLQCSDCHVMHYSQSHGYNPDGSGTFAALGGAGPYTYLLRNDINALCLTCHDGTSFAPDVLFTNFNTYTRQAGALNQAGSGLAPTGHTLDATDVAPGSVPAWSDAGGLNCANCHNPHGFNSLGNAYRNLREDPGNGSGVLVSYASGANVLTEDVWQAAASPLATHYAVSNINFNEPDNTKSEYAQFCKGCHTEFHGDKAGAELGGAGAGGTEWVRHPTNDADIGAVGGGHSSAGVFAGHTNNVQVMSESGVWPAADNTPSCMSCHKSHGNQNAFGLIYMSGTGTVDEEGDNGTSVRDLCRQCHVQG